jgi:hypothetical protein
MIAQSFFHPLQQASDRRALELLSPSPADIGAGGLAAGVTFTRTRNGTHGVPPLLGQDDSDAVLIAGEPPEDFGAGPIAYLRSSDAVIRSPAATPPSFVDVMFTSSPGNVSLPRPDVRLVIGVWGFYFGTGTAFGMPAQWNGPAYGGPRIRENERVRITERNLFGDGIPDAICVVPLVPFGRTVPPRDYVFTAVAGWV